MKVLLLDAYNLIYRAKSGFTKGEYPIVYNFFRGIRPLIEKFDPDKVYFVLEGDPKFRKQLSSGEYKSNRPKQGRSFHEQKATIINLIKNCFPFETVRHPDLECDDTIATYASLHARKGHDVTIVSSDSADKLCRNSNLLAETLENPEKREIFTRNVNLIRLVDFSNDLSQGESHVGSSDFKTLKSVFEEMEFTSMTKEKTWQKYCNTFQKL